MSTSGRLRELLEARNRTLVQDFAALERSLANVTVPSLLQRYQRCLQDRCRYWTNAATKNLARLQLPEGSILEDVLSETRQAMRYCRLISERLTAPVLRAARNDSLCLQVLSWIHSTHPRTRDIPVAFTEGNVAVVTLVTIAAVYYVPSLVQQSLLYLPLYFHEFGHVLYRLHKPEMDALVREIQEKVDRVMTPMSRRNDRHAEAQAAHRRKVVAAWYKWSIEVFCDAVGLEMSGPAYIYAFSSYLGLLSQGDFYRSAQDLIGSSHPTTWLRVRLLVRRARSLGLVEEATAIEGEWNAVANALSITEEHYGFYDNVLEDSVHSIVSDMLTETGPRRFLQEEGNPPRRWQSSDSPVYLLNYARRCALSDPSNYASLEADLVNAALAKQSIS